MQPVKWTNRSSSNSGGMRSSNRGPAARAAVANLEMELRRQKSEYRELSAILDTATDGVAVLDRQGLILTLNRSGEALFGYDQNEVAGKPSSI